MVAGCELEDGGTRGAEGGEFLAGEDVVGFPVGGEAEGCCYASNFCCLAFPHFFFSFYGFLGRRIFVPVKITFRIEPWNVEP